MLFALLSLIASRPVAVAARYDLALGWVNGRPQTWRERLNRATFAARSRVTFEAPELEHARMLRERAIRCAVYQENADVSGKAVFNVA